MKVVFFASSFSAFFQALQVLACRPELTDILWICSEPKLLTTLENLKIQNRSSRIISRPGINLMRSASRWPKILFFRLNEWLAFRRILPLLRGREIFYFDHFVWEIGLLWVKWCSRINRVFFFNSNPSLTSEGRERLLQREKKYRIGFGVKGIHFFFFQSNVSCVLTSDFLIEYGIKEWKPTLSEKELASKLSVFVPAEAKKYSAIVLIDAYPDAPFVNRIEFDRVWMELVRSLESRGEKVLVKPHPRVRTCPENLLAFSNDVLTPWPVELLLHEDSRFLIATASTAMLVPLDFPKLMRISVMEYVYRESDRKTHQLKLLKDSGNGILIPSSRQATVALIINA